MLSQKTFHLIVSRVGESLYDGDVISVILPGEAGEMTLLANHEALISSLKKGVITIRSDHETQTIDIEAGTLEVSNNQATVLL